MGRDEEKREREKTGGRRKAKAWTVFFWDVCNVARCQITQVTENFFSIKK